MIFNRIKPILAEQPEPIAYSYNGTILPPLPEWDKEVYPYALIEFNDLSYGNDYYSLYVGEELPRRVFDSVSNRERTAFNYKGSCVYIPAYNRLSWSESEIEADKDTEILLYNDDRFVWANTDIYNLDGSLFFATYKPTPIYE